MDETLFPKRKDRGTEGLDLFAPEPLCLICKASLATPDSSLCPSCAVDADGERDGSARETSHRPPHGHAA